MKKLILIISSVILLQSCTSGTTSGFFGGSMMGGAIGGLIGGPRGRDLGVILGGAAGAAAGAAIDQANSSRSYSAYEDGYEDGYSRGRSSVRSSYRDNTSSYRTNSNSSANSYSSRPSTSQKYQIASTQTTPACPFTMRNLRFVDDNNNHALNPEENAQIIFELTNTTNETITDVVPYVSELSGNEHVFLSPSERIASMKPHETVRYICHIKTDKKITAGTMNFRIAVSSANTDFCTLREFTLQTAK